MHLTNTSPQPTTNSYPPPHEHTTLTKSLSALTHSDNTQKHTAGPTNITHTTKYYAHYYKNR